MYLLFSNEGIATCTFPNILHFILQLVSSYFEKYSFLVTGHNVRWKKKIFNKEKERKVCLREAFKEFHGIYSPFSRTSCCWPWWQGIFFLNDTIEWYRGLGGNIIQGQKQSLLNCPWACWNISLTRWIFLKASFLFSNNHFPRAVIVEKLLILEGLKNSIFNLQHKSL